MKTQNLQKKGMKRGSIVIILTLFLMFSLFTSLVSADNNTSSVDDSEKVKVYFFWGDGCPHCETQKSFLEEWENKYSNNIEVKMFEVWNNDENLKIFQKIASIYGTQAGGVPTTFIGEKYWVGFSEAMAPEIEEYIKQCIEEGCENLGSNYNSDNNNEYFNESNDLCLHIFTKENQCPQCEGILSHVESLESEYNFEIKKYDISLEKNRALFNDLKENYGLKAEMYPTIFIGEKYISGEESIRKALEKEIKNCLDSGCPCPITEVKPYTPITTSSKDVSVEKNQNMDIPLIGEIDLSSMSLGVVTALMGFVDGFNPCSLWVLTFLLGIVIYTGSRKKIVIVGLTFLLVTTAAYGLFMLGLVNVFKYVGYLSWIQGAVALIAGVFAIVNIKDYFWYKKGISFTISDKYKPKIFKDIREIMKGEGSIWAMVSGTAIMALGIVLIELPCTAGFPVIWTNLMAENNVNGMSFALLLLLYLGVYLLDELIVFSTVAFTLKASKFEEKHGRILKLIGGIIMLALAIVLVANPNLMNDIGGALLVFGIAIAVSFLIIFIHRKILPKFGIVIGSEALENKEAANKEDMEEPKNIKKEKDSTNKEEKENE